ncbi:MAG: hypothetical protein MJ110_06980 [Lachnospiraceae bacterium]|nr:hypothetical protein [Lachnospiraceae bacterium]
MIKKKIARKTYVRPEAEATWMESEGLMAGIGGSAGNQPESEYGEEQAKGYSVSLVYDKTWGMEEEYEDEEYLW